MKLRRGVVLGVVTVCVLGSCLGASLDASRTAQAVAAGQITVLPNDQALVDELVDAVVQATGPDGDLARTRRTLDSKLKDKFSKFGLSSYYPHDEHYPLDYEHKAFDVFSFKKAIFKALLQAIKAITGGAIALKGQLVKVKGHLVAAGGKLLVTKGDKITEFGKHVATKALTTPVHVPTYSHPPVITGYGSTGFGGYPGVMGPAYGVPAYGPPAISYGPPGYHGGAPIYDAHSLKRDAVKLPDGVHAGLIVLKPLSINQGLQPAPSYNAPQATYQQQTHATQEYVDTAPGYSTIKRADYYEEPYHEY